MWTPPPGSRPTPPSGDFGVTQPTPIIIPGVTPGTAAGAGGGNAGAAPPKAGKAKKNSAPLVPGAPYDHRQGFWFAHVLARLLAFLVDTVGIAFVLAAFGFDLVDHGSLALAPRHDQNGWFVLVSLSLVVAIGFAFLCEAIIGTTLGKALFMLQVRRFDGRREGFGRALVRYLLLPIDLLLIGPLLVLVTPKHRRLGDFAAETVVGRSPIGPVATAISVVLLAVLGYAQAAYGGGLTSAIGVSAETATYLPAIIGGAANGIEHGFGIVGGIAPVPSASASPLVLATPYPEASTAISPSPGESGLQTPGSQPSADPQANPNAEQSGSSEPGASPESSANAQANPSAAASPDAVPEPSIAPEPGAATQVPAQTVSTSQ